MIGNCSKKELFNYNLERQRPLPITLLAKEDFFRVASPRSPIFTRPVVPLIKILSHLRSRCMIGGVLV